MQTITIFNFLPSKFAAKVANAKGAIVVLLMLMLSMPALAQNGTYTLLGFDDDDDDPVYSNNSTVQTPFMLNRQDYKIQYLYRAQELFDVPNSVPTTAGPKTIKTLYFYVQNLPNNTDSHSLTNFRLKIGNTSLSDLGGADWGNDWSTANYPGQITGFEGTITITQQGWVPIDLGAGFEWDGTSNIIVELTRSNPNGTPRTNTKTFGVMTGEFASSVSSRTVRSAYTRSNWTDENFGITGEEFVIGAGGNAISGNNIEVMNTFHRKFRPVVRFQMTCGSMVSSEGLSNGDAFKIGENSAGGCRTFILGVKDVTDAHGLEFIWQRSNSASFTVAEEIGTGKTITVKQSIAARHYRRKTSCGGVGVYSNHFTVPAAPGNDYNNGWINGTPGPTSDRVLTVSNGTAVIASDAKACGCIVGANGTMKVNSGVTLQVDGAVSVHADASLTFEDDASLVQVDPTAVNNGKIIYKRETTPMALDDYTYYSSPVNTTVSAAAPLTLVSKIFSFTPMAQAWAGVTAATVMTAGKGFIIRTPEGHVTGNTHTTIFTGTPYNGNVTVPITLGTDRFNLIGNPYPSAIKAEDLYLANADKLDGTFYFWTHNSPITNANYTANDYAVMNSMGTVIAAPSAQQPNGYIAAGQSVMVKAKDGTPIAASTILIDNTMRRGGSVNGTFFRPSAMEKNSPLTTTVENEKHRIWLNISNPEAFKQLMVGYTANATPGYDNAYDGKALPGPKLSFYSKLDALQLGIQARPLPFDINDVVPLGFSTSVAGTHTIDMPQYDGMFEGGIMIYLEDLLLNTVHDLRSGSYTFVSEAGSFPDRFVLKYGMDSNLDINTSVADVNDLIAFKQLSSLHVASGNIILDSVKVFDLSGRLLTTQVGNGTKEIVIDSPNWSSQVLIVQAITTDRIILTKKVVF